MEVVANPIKQDGAVEDLFTRVDGLRIHYRRAGSGRPLLLVHGLVGSARNWNRNIEDLARGATVYAIDLPNMGESDRLAGLDSSLEASADRLARWMDTIGLDEADVAGHSHGGAVAMMLAARHPHRVDKLMLFAPANPYCDLSREIVRFYKTRIGYCLANLIPRLPAFVQLTGLRYVYGNPARVRMEVLKGYTAGLATPGTVDHVLGIVRRWYIDMELLRSELSKLIDRPTLLIWGDRDRTVGLSSARQLHKLLPQSKLLIVPGAGHIPFEEDPEVCNRAMRQWLSTPATAALASAVRTRKAVLRTLEAI
jgi:pimeloyl-ACP methyl ester carboxylesterase